MDGESVPMSRRWLPPALALLSAAVLMAVLNRYAAVGYGGWQEVRLGPGVRTSEPGSWRFEEILIPLVHPAVVDTIEVGCGGGSNDYCTFYVFRQGSRSSDGDLVLRFAGNCDAFWPPRMWVEPPVEKRARRLLTYHQYLVNTDIGEDLAGGYWLWTWDGSRFRPSRP